MRSATPTWRGGELAIGLGLAIGVFLLKWEVLDLPYHWDELGAYAIPTHWLADHGLAGALPGRHPPGTFFGHPPALYLVLAALHRALGESVLVSHVLALGFTILAVWGTYRLGTHLRDRTAGLVAACCFFATPITFAQSGMFLADLPVAGLGVVCVDLFLRGHRFAYLVLACALVLVKETGAAIPFAIVLFLALLRRRDPQLGRKLLVHALPLALLAAFLIAQRITTGRWVPNPYFESHPFLDLAPTAVAVGLAKTSGWILVAQQRWALTLLVALALWRFRRDFWRDEYTLFAILSALYVLPFSVLYVLPRYLLPVLPFFCITAAVSLSRLVRSRAYQALGCIAIVALSATQLFGEGTAADSYSENMEYADVVRIHRDVARYLEESCPDARVLAHWPLSSALALPYLGYVRRPLSIVPDPSTADVVVTTPQGSAGNAELRARVEGSADFALIKRFERSGKSARVFARSGGRGCGVGEGRAQGASATSLRSISPPRSRIDWISRGSLVRVYHSMVRRSPSRKLNWGVQPSFSRARRLSATRLRGPVGMPGRVRIGASWPLIWRTSLAASRTRMRSIVPRFTALPSSIASAARSVPATMSST